MTAPSAAELIERYGEPDDIAEDPTSGGNNRRADFAWEAIKAYVTVIGHSARTEADFDGPDCDIIGEVVGDLVCDLMHWITRTGNDVEEVLDKGRRHFEAEVGLGYES